jgi:hypothetical protein
VDFSSRSANGGVKLLEDAYLDEEKLMELRISALRLSMMIFDYESH